MRTRSRCTSAYWRYEKKHLVPIILMSQFRRTISRNYIELKVVMRTRSRCTARIGDTRKDTWSRRSRCCGFADQLWVVTKDRAEWKELSVSAEDVSKEVETLRAGLNPDSPRPLTAISHISSYRIGSVSLRWVSAASPCLSQLATASRRKPNGAFSHRAGRPPSLPLRKRPRWSRGISSPYIGFRPCNAVA
jgi:hypothetical protein